MPSLSLDVKDYNILSFDKCSTKHFSLSNFTPGSLHRIILVLLKIDSFIKQDPMNLNSLENLLILKFFINNDYIIGEFKLKQKCILGT